jgi:hypothetical protein
VIRFALLLLALQAQVGGLVHDATTSILFPQAVRFYVEVDLPLDQIESAELTITPEGRDPIPLSIDPAEWIFYNDALGTKLLYTWAIPVDYPPLPLFGNVDYQWTFTSTDGGVGELDGSFIYTDPRPDWVHSADPDGNFSVTMPRALSPLINALRQTHNLLEENTGSRTEYNLLVYPSSVMAGCVPNDFSPDNTVVLADGGIRIECTPDVEDLIFADYRVARVPPGEDSETYLVNVLVQDACARFWNGKEVPAWFSSGLAQFYAPSPKNSQLPPVRQAARSGELFSLEEMQTEQDDPLWEAQAFGMFLYLVDHITPEGAYELARVNGANFPVVYDRLMDIPQTGLLPAWQQWIFTRAAESVYGITPYQPPTLTPSITPTPSNTPTDTPLPTLTPSITPTPSLTPRGVRTYVAPPTLTASPSFTPRPPSVTPRPPGSLPTITPTPTELQAFAEQPEVRIGGGAFVVLGLAVILFLLFRSGNRR